MINHSISDISQNFRFCIGSEWKDSEAVEVCLPHTVELTPAISSGCRNYQGKCIYEKTLFIPKEYEGKKVWIEFEGAMGVCELFINDKKAADHLCGYIPFVADIGEYLNFDADNVLRITLDNSDNGDVPPGKPQRDLDFTYDGGLYRKATLTVSEPLYITEPLLEREVAGGGVFVHYSDVSEKSATVHAKIQVKNEFAERKKFVFEVSLIDAEGKTVCKSITDAELDTLKKESYEQSFLVENPRLWSISDPNLYTLCARIFLEGECVFEKNTEIGIRTFKYTIDNGVIFNGTSHRFSGVNYHQTWPYIGNAVPDSLLLRDMMKLKEMGCENIRSHYPFGHAVTDACNRLGMTLIVSNPGWQWCREGDFLERACENMRQIIRWQRNNPAIILWEPILNESKMNYDIQLRFHEVVHEEYPYKDCYTASDYGPTDVSYQDYSPGMIGYEDYGFIEKRDLTPTPIWTREYGDDPDNFHDQNTIWRMPRRFGDYPMVESVNRMLKKYMDSERDSVQYIDVYNNKKRCGYGVWPGIEHNRGYHINPCYGGHLDLFRVPKFSYYFMKSQQDIEKAGAVLFIASWWSDISPDDVTVYSNAERVELWCDGVLVASQTPDNVAVKHPPFTFKSVRRKYKVKNRSNLTARAVVGAEQVAEVSMFTPGVPEALKLEIDSMGVPMKADGADIVAVRCYVIDNMGGVVPMMGDAHPILFSVEGEGEIVGDSSIWANPICPEGGVATVLVRSSCKPGEIKVRARLLWEQGRGEKIPCSVQSDEIVIITE